MSESGKELRRGMRELASELYGAQTANRIFALFRLVEVAEEEIEAANDRHPPIDFSRAFNIVRPAFPGGPPSERLYRIHCRELLDRIAAGASRKEINAGTDAEVLDALQHMSLTRPPGEDEHCFYWRLFERWFPEDAARLEAETGHTPRESYPGRLDELSHIFRTKLSKKRGEVSG